MQKLAALIALILLLAFPGAVFARQIDEPSGPQKIKLNPPTAIPHDLDELYDLVENGGPGWDNFTPCAQKGLVKPYFQWSMVAAIQAASRDDRGTSRLILPAKDLAKILAPGGITYPTRGTLDVSEDTLFASLVQEVLQGDVLLCSQSGDLTLFGPGAQQLFDQLAPK